MAACAASAVSAVREGPSRRSPRGREGGGRGSAREKPGTKRPGAGGGGGPGARMGGRWPATPLANCRQTPVVHACGGVLAPAWDGEWGGSEPAGKGRDRIRRSGARLSRLGT